MEFQEAKAALLLSAKQANACAEQYKRAIKAETHTELLTVVKENIAWLISNNAANAEKLELWFGETILTENNIFIRGERRLSFSENTLLVLLDSSQATVKTLGSSQATVETLGGKLITNCEGGLIQNRTTRKIEVKKSDYELLIIE